MGRRIRKRDRAAELKARLAENARRAYHRINNHPTDADGCVFCSALNKDWSAYVVEDGVDVARMYAEALGVD